MMRRPRIDGLRRSAVALGLALGCSGTGKGVEPARRPALVAPHPAPPRFVESLDVTTFRRGNLHAHSTNSDGDHSPEDVILWYRNRGYAFLALTDHNRRTDLDRYA